MTRFIMSLDEAVDLVLFAFEHGQNGDILVQKAPACTIGTQAEAVCELFGGNRDDIRVIGIRHGEKMYETLLTNEECAKAEDLGNFYRVPADNRGLNYDKYFKEGDETRNPLTEFNLQQHPAAERGGNEGEDRVAGIHPAGTRRRGQLRSVTPQ